jgi:hypothetical protein
VRRACRIAAICRCRERRSSTRACPCRIVYSTRSQCISSLRSSRESSSLSIGGLAVYDVSRGFCAISVSYVTRVREALC